MKVARSLAEVTKDASSVVTVGTFDGVHLAHQEIIRDVVNWTRMIEGRSVVITFDPHPKEVVGKRDRPIALLTTLEERIALIGKMHVDVLLVIEFTYGFSLLGAREFYQKYVVDGTGVSEVVVGYDHMFGHDRAGGVEELIRLGQEFNFSVSAVHPFRIQGEIVSSTRVRDALASGDIERAAELLGYSYGFSGTVVRGDGRGKTLGYPTANIEPGFRRKLIPGHGVYFVGITLRGTPRYGMMNIGVRPTIRSGGGTTHEVHVFGMDEDVYGERAEVTFLKKLRNEQKFSSLEELINQMRRDKELSLRYIAELDKRQ